MNSIRFTLLNCIARQHKYHPIRMGVIYFLCILLSSAVIVFSKHITENTRKNIVLIVADDLGWNDVSLHGMDQVLTPNIDMLGYSGVAFDRYYSHCICTPSRSALLTGKYAYTTGMQGYPLTNSEDTGLPVLEKILPQYLKELGYSTHLVGKWHLGSSREEYLPTKRGFDSHFGHRGGYIDYYEYLLEETWDIGMVSGMDLYRNDTPDWNTEGYITDVYSQEAISIIKCHDVTTPLFLMLAHNAPHFGNHDALVQAPPDVVRSMRYVQSPGRRTFAAMVKKLDDSVGDVIEALMEKEILNNTIILFISDNGAPTTGSTINYGSNWPLRGSKMSPYEGGARVTAVLWTPEDVVSHLYKGYVHVSDWLPTLLGAIGTDTPDKIDGNNMWHDILSGKDSKRNEMVDIGIADGYMSIINGDYKLITGKIDKLRGNYDGGDLLGIIEKPPPYMEAITSCKTYEVFKKLGRHVTAQGIDIRNKLKIRCESHIEKDEAICYSEKGKVCLFDIQRDPCERNDLSQRYPDIVEKLAARLEAEQLRVIPRVFPIIRDPKSNPVFHNYTWNIFIE